MEFENENEKALPKHVLDMQLKFRIQLKLRESLDQAVSCVLMRDSKGNLRNILNKFKPDWYHKHDKVKSSDVIGVVKEVQRLLSLERYKKAIEFISKVKSQNESLNEVLNVWMALSFIW
jgi:hypothetical protein